MPVGYQNSVRDERNRGFTGGTQVSAPRTGSRVQVVGTVNLWVFRRHPSGASALGFACKAG
jgi:hypothetical protein